MIQRLIFAAASAAVICVTAQGSDSVNFSHNVAPILYGHCTACHHSGDIAPMPLLTYQQARPWARAIRQAVVTRQMPPWQADNPPGQFTNDPRLSDHDIDVLKRWVDSGAPEGNPHDLPVAPVYREGWKIGQPDEVVPIPADYVVKPGSSDQYVYLHTPTNFKEDRWVTAVELKPGNRKVVHHAHVWLYQPKDRTTNANQSANEPMIKRDGVMHINPSMPVVDDGCADVDNGNLPGKKAQEGNILGSYLPGKAPDVFPEGFARLIPKGAALEFQIHYNSGTIKEDATDRTSVGLIFAKQPPRQPLRRIDISNYLFKIPAGDNNHRVTACYTFGRDVELMSYTAHMHLRGKDMMFEAVHPDGRRETLVSVPRYDFNWQIEYKLATPVSIERGTRIMITAHFDNSPNNRYNPDPMQIIRWGEPSHEEMMDGWIEFILPPQSVAAR